MRLTRRGFGVACLAALTLPAVMMVGSLGLSFQASTARVFTSTVWMSYVGLELCEAAIAEAAHFLEPADVFDPALFPEVSRAVDPGLVLLTQMVDDRLPDVPGRAYRTIEDETGAEAARMLVAFTFPKFTRVVKGRGLARKLAAENRGVLLDRPEDLRVTVTPLSFRRDYYAREMQWRNWGVVQFAVSVRTRELKGVSIHRLRVDRRFTLKSKLEPGAEAMTVSSHNLRTFVSQEDQ